MLKKILVTLVMLFSVAGVHAQFLDLAEVDGQLVDLLPAPGPRSMDLVAIDYEGEVKRAGVTAETVGDPYSFGREKTYLGVAQTRPVTMTTDCTGHPPEGGPCIVLNPAPASTLVDEIDLAVIELPRRSTHSLLCFTFTPFASWNWANTTGSPQAAEMMLRPRVRIESEVLEDPSLIDPGTGLPFNGVLLDSTITTFLQSRTLNPGETDSQYRSMTRSCTAGLVNISYLRDSYGLSDAVIRQFFRKPITVSFGAGGHVSMVDYAHYSVGIRLYGD